MGSCNYCKELNEEKNKIEIEQIYTGDGYFDWSCVINFCPYCGEKLNKKE